MNKRPPLTLSGIPAELRRRGVYPAIAAYGVMAWVLLQIGEVTFEPLGFPPWAMRALIAMVVIGFPIVLVMSWMFDITTSGLRRDRRQPLSTAGTDQRPSVAVLPFVDMSPQRDQGYFCEGIAEEILNALTRLEQLRVMSRTSSFRYAADTRDAREIGAELGVETLLEGSVRKSGDHLRVTADLVDVASGSHLCSHRFDKELEDIFEIQDEIARSIAQSLMDTLTPGEASIIKTTSAGDVLAYEYYLRGRHFANRFRKSELKFARQMFRQAIDIDPLFAAAWAGYADCHSLLIMYADPQEGYLAEADTASRRSLELAPGLAEAHASRGLACLAREDFDHAQEHFVEALRINPQLFEAHYYYARTKFHQGDMEAAAQLFQRAAQVNPSDYQSRCLRIQILRGMGRLDDARAEAKDCIDVLEKHLMWHPDDIRALHLGAGSLIVAGQVERAKDWLRRALEIDPDDSIVLYNVACNFATLDDVDEAMTYLERAVDHGVVSLAWMLNDSDLINVRGHPRFNALVETLKRMAPADIHDPLKSRAADLQE